MIRCQSRASSPSFAWGPTGWSVSEPSALEWKPTAVTPPCATGDWIRRFPTVASTCGCGGADVTGALAGAPASGELLERSFPKAVTASVTTASTVTATASTNQRARACARRRLARSRAA